MEGAYGEFAPLYDKLMADVDYRAWAKYVMELTERFLPTGREGSITAVDCGCGTGEITCLLAAEGWTITGVDISCDMLRLAQQKARSRGLKIPFIQGDMQSFLLHRPVDVVLACCDGVNYLDSLECASQFFSAANRALQPGGLLLFDISSTYKLEQVLDGHTFGETAEDCAYLWQNVYDPQTRLLEMDLTFFIKEGGSYRRFEETHIQRAHDVNELDGALKAAGFTVLGAYDAFTTNPYRVDSERIQWVARKL